ncbi:MAG: nucleotidyltransferase domain-containing protein [Candidatus Fermentibacteraceae bacterium]|nr:nucleotidyltransferase domain-containing protein [Candidatus Fermentibacteraceae bacterium]
MGISDQTIEKLRKFCESCGINTMYLFGSYARNEADSASDLDLLVVFDDNLQLSYLDVLKLKEELEKLTGTRIDLLEEKAIRNPLRRKRILEERVLLYAS